MKLKLDYNQKLELAEWIASMNDGAITGSLMLKRRGIDLGREPQDIDIIVSSNYSPEDIILPPFVDKKEEGYDKEGYRVLERCYIFGIKIEFMIDDKSLRNAKNNISAFWNYKAKYCTIEDLVNAKEEYIIEDEHADYVEKSKKDLIIIEDYLKQFPIIRYKVYDNGFLSKMICNGKVDDFFMFDEYNMNYGISKFSEWMVKESDKIYASFRYKSLNDDLYKSFDEASKIAKERWNKFMNPNGKYVVSRYFDDYFDGDVTEPLSKKEAYDKMMSLNGNNTHYLTEYIIRCVD